MNDIMDRCDLCGGELRPGKTTLEIWLGAKFAGEDACSSGEAAFHGEELLVIKDVSADVCQQCHEAYISAEVSEKLDHFLTEHHRHRPERYITVPQYSAAQAMGI